MPWWYTKYVSLVHCGRVGGGTGQGPATEVTCFVKSTSNISSRCYLSTRNTAIVKLFGVCDAKLSVPVMIYFIPDLMANSCTILRPH